MIKQETIERVKQIDFIDFLERQEGYSFLQEGSYCYRCKQDKTLVLHKKDGVMLYCWNGKGNDSGDIISFVMRHYTNENFKEAINYLLNNCETKELQHRFVEVNNRTCEDNNSINIEYSNNMQRSYAYLCKTRGLDYNIISDLAVKGLLAEDTRHNVIFKYIDENKECVGAEAVGTNTFKKYKGVVKYSDESYGFNIMVGDSRNINKVIVFESAIDLISYYQIYNKSLKQSILLSLAGCSKIKKIDTYLRGYETIKEIVVCVDNDDSGSSALNEIKERYSDHIIKDGREELLKHNLKDFNDLLLYEGNN